MPYSITTKDGITIQNIPDEVQPDAPELKQRVADIRAGKPQAAPAADKDAMRSEMVKSELTKPVRDFGNAAAGAVRGAGSIGATLMAPQDMLEDWLRKRLTGKEQPSSNDQRRQDMTNALQTMGADPKSIPFQAGKVGTEIAGTLGVGPAMAGAAAPMLPARMAPILQAVETAGMRAGGLTGAAGVGARATGGAITGGASAGLVNPDDVGLGAGIGAALPPLVQAGGVVGNAVGSLVKPASVRAAERMASALDTDPAMVAQQLRQSRTLVPGASPTVAQVLRTPQASTLERVVSESAGGAGLKAKYAAQNEARRGMLERVAPTDPRGVRSAQEDFGAAALSTIRGGDKGARAATSAAYKAVPQDQAAIYLPDLAAIRDEFFPAGAFGGRESVDEAVRVAKEIGTESAAAVRQTKAGKPAQSLAQFVRSRGGVNLGGGLAGEAASLRGEAKNLVRANGGKNLNELAEAAFEAGLIRSESPDVLLDALRNEARRGPAQATDQGMRAAYEAAMGDVPGAVTTQKKVTLGEVDALRKSIGNAQRAAARDPGRATEAAALSRMKTAIDDRINEVVRGDGAIDENLPIAWADQLTEAQRLKKAQVGTYRTGPQAQAFRTGSDNLPSVQGGEFARLVWGSRPGVADDLKQFRKVMDDQPELLKQFRSMVTTEGGATATGGGRLTDKFVRWVDNTLPGLGQAFEPREVAMLRRIADDIRRSNQAAAVGSAAGSPTYQNASNALSLGLLDSPLLNAAANRVPLVNAATGPALNWMREGARERMARELAAYLADPRLAANALQQLRGPQPSNALLSIGLGRSVPAIAADR